MSGGNEVHGVAVRPAAALLATLPLVVATTLLAHPRTLVSWHGFAGVAVAERIAAGSLPPENPFLAGTPLSESWLHPALATGLAHVIGCDSLRALALLSLGSLALLCFGCLWLGARRFDSVGVGLLIGWLALVGANPGGPAIAAVRAVREGIPLVEFFPEPVETVYVSDESSELFQVHPLLRALYVGDDWRIGQNFVWYLDNGSIGPALACALFAVLLFLGPTTRVRGVGSALLGATAAGLDPIAGAGAMLATLFGSVATATWRRRADGPATGDLSIRLAGAASIGALVAIAVFDATLPSRLAGGAAWSSLGALAKRALALGASYCVLLPLALMGARAAAAPLRGRLGALALGGAALCVAAACLRLPSGEEHALANAAAVLLAVPAASFAAGSRARRWGVGLLIASFLPVTLLTLGAFSGHPGLPLASADGVLLRTPAEDPLARLYAWIRGSTPADAVFVIDPGHPVKMATNVSELPAFTGRALFVDQPSRWTPLPDSIARVRLAADLTAGEPLDAVGLATLCALSRPVYLVSHAGDDEHLAERLTRRYGPPRFAAGFVGVYVLAIPSRGAPNEESDIDRDGAHIGGRPRGFRCPTPNAARDEPRQPRISRHTGVDPVAPFAQPPITAENRPAPPPQCTINSPLLGRNFG